VVVVVARRACCSSRGGHELPRVRIEAELLHAGGEVGC
jgi:hypothetical protein